jgi:hypothetical protein
VLGCNLIHVWLHYVLLPFHAACTVLLSFDPLCLCAHRVLFIFHTMCTVFYSYF